MLTILLFVLLVVAVLLIAMWLSPSFKATVSSKWGAVGAGLVAILAWVASWFAGSAPLPPM